jgi:hypothetical protein
MALAMASNLELALGEECWKTNLEAAGTRSLHSMAAKIQPEVVAAMWKVHRLWEILSTTS